MTHRSYFAPTELDHHSALFIYKHSVPTGLRPLSCKLFLLPVPGQHLTGHHSRAWVSLEFSL